MCFVIYQAMFLFFTVLKFHLSVRVGCDRKAIFVDAICQNLLNIYIKNSKSLAVLSTALSTENINNLMF